MKPPTPTSYLLLAPLAIILLVFVVRPPSRAGSDGLGALCARRAGFAAAGARLQPADQRPHHAEPA